MNKTDIEYLDFTWNPLAMLCDPVSVGCQNCWHRRRAKMLANNPKIPKEQQDAYAGRSHPLLIKSRLEQPSKKKKPSIIGVQFMGDLFHKNVPTYGTYGRIFDVVYMATRKKFMKPKPLSQSHKFLFLTKRPERMLERVEYYRGRYGGMMPDNFWAGVTAENQERYDERWTIASKIPAAVKFVSLEPALEYINIDIFAPWPDWVIWGSETGPGKRPYEDEWAEATYEQCREKKIPFFDKRSNYLSREFPKARLH